MGIRTFTIFFAISENHCQALGKPHENIENESIAATENLCHLIPHQQIM